MFRADGFLNMISESFGLFDEDQNVDGCSTKELISHRSTRQALGNISGDSPNFRDLVPQSGGRTPLVFGGKILWFF